MNSGNKNYRGGDRPRPRQVSSQFSKPRASFVKPVKTSWDGVAGWYDALLEKEGTYQKEVILPNLIRLMDIQKGDRVLDLACGQGFFSFEFTKKGAEVYGVDLSKELIEIAKKKASAADLKIQFFAAPASELKFLNDNFFDKIAVILAIQNMENVASVLQEAARVLKPGGKLFVVMNHPAFRVPKRSDWGFDDVNKIQYRRLDGYMSESKERIQMHPGDNPDDVTLSFHRPLQVYFKAFKKAGFLVGGLEEWMSHKRSEPGPRAAAEDKARKEFPMFLLIEAVKL